MKSGSAIYLISAFLLTHSVKAQSDSSFETFDSSFSDEAIQYFAEPAGTSVQQIKDIAAKSACAKYSWKSRGTAPVGYVKGVALSYARSLCRVRASNPVSTLAPVMAAANSRNSKKDAIAHYQSTFASQKIPIETAGADALSAIYTLGIGLGMRESSGSYCEGWDTSAGSNRPSSAGEAGAFQTSYDSIGANSELKKLYAEYQASPQRCLLDAFKEGVRCRNQGVLGSGAGAAFQSFNKACPAFATEYAMTLLRVLRSHFGPINRKEAEVKNVCFDMFGSVRKLIESNPEMVCREIY